MGGYRRDDLEPDWAAHAARAGELADVPTHGRFYGRDGRRIGQEWAERVRDAPADVTASLLLLLIRGAPGQVGGPDVHDLTWSLEQVLGRRRLVVPAAEAAWAVRTVAGMPDTWGSHAVMAAAAALAAWCNQPDDPGLQSAVEVLAATVDAYSEIPAADRTRIRKRMLPLRPAARTGGVLDVTMIRPDDGWSAAVLDQAARWQGDAHAANLLLRHLAAAAGSKPSQRWLERAATLLQDPGAVRILRLLVESVATAKPVMVRYGYDREMPYLFTEPNMDLLRAACWSAGVLAADWAAPALCSAADRSMFGSRLSLGGYMASAKVPNACVYGLGLIGSEPAIAGLLELQRRLKHGAFHKQIAAALAAAAARAGLTLGELAERLVADGGLDARGERQIAAGGTVGWVRIGDGWRGQNRMADPGGPFGSSPG